MLSRSQAFAAAFSAKKALLNVNATVNAERTFTFIPSMYIITFYFPNDPRVNSEIHSAGTMLPRSAVHRAAHADGVAFGADAVELLGQCGCEFLDLLAFEASSLPAGGKRKPIASEHVVAALGKVRCADFVAGVEESGEAAHSRAQEAARHKTKKWRRITPDEEAALAAEQQALLLASGRAAATTAE